MQDHMKGCPSCQNRSIENVIKIHMEQLQKLLTELKKYDYNSDENDGFVKRSLKAVNGIYLRLNVFVFGCIKPFIIKEFNPSIWYTLMLIDPKYYIENCSNFKNKDGVIENLIV